MKIQKEHKEFHTLDLNDGWHTPDWQTSWLLLQSALLVQSAWQKPLMQVALPAQSLL